MDTVFKFYYDLFKHVFEDCEISFKRKVLKKCELVYIVPSSEEERRNKQKDDLIRISDDNPVVVQAGSVSKKVYFIISGHIHIMDKDGIFLYGTIREGSCFGEISLLLD